MRTIFIATDFSEAAHNASLYGIELAKAFGSDVILYNGFQVPIAPPKAIDIVTSAEMKENIQGLFQEEIRRLDPSGYTSVETVCEELHGTHSILESANDRKADLIIIGMKAKGKSMRHFFGSTATGLVGKTNIPLLIIPETAKYSIPKIITLASDIKEETTKNIHLLYFLRQIAEKFDSKIYVVRVGERKFNELTKPISRLNCLLAKLDVKYEYVDDYSITQGLNHFIKEHKSNLVVMIPHQHDFLERLFIKSETKEMLFHSRIPMLVLPERSRKTINQQSVLSDREQSL
jgi:nucleotide-binding universal stress UspA family protein